MTDIAGLGGLARRRNASHGSASVTAGRVRCRAGTSGVALSSRRSAIAVDELLHRPERRPVRLARVFDQLECRAELVVQAIGAVAHHGQAAAAERSIRAEGGDDHMAAGPDATVHGPDVSLALIRFSEEV